MCGEVYLQFPEDYGAVQGEEQYAVDENGEYLAVQAKEGAWDMALLTINAIDGSVVNRV